MSMREGVVENLTLAGEAYPNWHLLKLQGAEAPLLLHHNWVIRNGVLKQGDRVSFQVAKQGTYSDQAVYLSRLQKLDVG